ncbi:hypothetical protein M409DRAFT_63116 [Zasmidium cellare ATCC 36951]|uniref:Uncharacterized protein n=1 Tax=Zasmidium cellare ATCC 36951 TaxID=1080233 RepID=A0A6A6CYY8_ZASCE|nr:uncharacterized protein M409DRAFT_63116 [Zasmidium cellare ATCC 36951]KAF2172427.1 hypothetical protein M409DRAFT_63116 [Zasmidium cellare ATCC 36951]
MAELQTVAAVFDLLKVTYEAGKFLKKVKDADKIAFELWERMTRLDSVLNSVKAVLQDRDDHDASSGSHAQVSAQVAETIRGSVQACTRTVNQLQQRVGGFDNQVKRSVLDKWRIALRQPSITRINDELEARVHVLSTELAVLQLFDQTRTGAVIENNHNELLQAIERLGAEVEEGNRIQKQMMHRHHEWALKNRQQASSADPTPPNEDALDSLSQCLRTAEDIHEHYTSEYFPDDRSERIKRVDAEQTSASPFAVSTPPEALATPSTGQVSVPISADPAFTGHALVADSLQNDDEDDDDESVWPLDMLNTHIKAYAEQAAEKRDAEQFNQAEFNLHRAIRNSETRESHYGVPFEDRAQMQEELAFLYQKQRKWSEAVSTVHQLLRERSSSVATTNGSIASKEQPPLAQARQHYLLASIYYDRYMNNAGMALAQSANDIEKAENHAMKAFNKQWKSSDTSDQAAEEVEQQRDCIELFARILETRDKTVEASGLRKLLVERPGSSAASDSLRRISTHTRPQPDFDVVDKHDILVEAIKSGDSEQVHNMLASDLNLERLCSKGKTFLMHAVEKSDESTVHKLLGPEYQVDVNTANKRGLTALHYAASNGLNDMARCLLHHDADVEPRDRKGEAPVVRAVIAGHTSMVEVFFQWDETTLQTKGVDEWSLLHYAVHKSSREMIDLLLELAPDLKDSVDRAGKTALHHCAESEKLEQATALLDHGRYSESDVNATDSMSRNALYFAASRAPTAHRESMVRLLLSKGAMIEEVHPPPRMRDYIALKRSIPRRDSTLSHASVSTSGMTSTTTSSSASSDKRGNRVKDGSIFAMFGFDEVVVYVISFCVLLQPFLDFESA